MLLRLISVICSRYPCEPLPIEQLTSEVVKNAEEYREFISKLKQCGKNYVE
jgi:hypothetical protein